MELKLVPGAWSGTTFTDRDGQFEFPGLASGTYRVTVSAPECAKLEETAQVDATFTPLLLRLHKRTAPPPGASGFTVSVQELRIPAKALKAFDKGAHQLDTGDSTGSLVHFQRAIAEFPAYYQAYYNLGVAQLRLSHMADAQQAFQKSIDLSGGGYALPHFALGLVLCGQQEFPTAEIVIQRGLDRDPGSAVGKYFLALAQFGLNHLAEAEKSVRQALLRKSGLAQAYLLLAKIHMRQNNSSAVVEDLHAYLNLDSKSPRSAETRVLLENTQRTLTQNAASSLVAGSQR